MTNEDPNILAVPTQTTQFDFNRFTQEMEALIHDMELFLSGEKEVKNENGDVVRVRVDRPKVNEAGKNAILNWLRAYLNPNTYLAYTKSGDTPNNYILDVRDIADDLTINHAKYALSYEDFQSIHAKICLMVFMALRKAETDKKFIFEAMQTKYQATAAPEKHGWFDFLKLK